MDVYYAGKSFLCTAVAAGWTKKGCGWTRASGGELAVAARAGIAGADVALHGNNKSDAEINRALDMNLGRIVVDSLDELERVAKIASGRGETAKVMLRLTPGVHAHTHEFIATAHEDQKFGLSMAEDSTDEAGLSAAEEAVAAATSLRQRRTAGPALPHRLADLRAGRLCAGRREAPDLPGRDAGQVLHRPART